MSDNKIKWIENKTWKEFADDGMLVILNAAGDLDRNNRFRFEYDKENETIKIIDPRTKINIELNVNSDSDGYENSTYIHGVKLRGINRLLHIFGWAICVNKDPDTDMITDIYPARCKYRGFIGDNPQDYVKLTQYLKNNIDSLLEESKLDE